MNISLIYYSVIWMLNMSKLAKIHPRKKISTLLLHQMKPNILLIVLILKQNIFIIMWIIFIIVHIFF